jgi:hypothetical protein
VTDPVAIQREYYRRTAGQYDALHLEGEGLAYSYSVFQDYPSIRRACRSVHIINTTPAGVDPYRSATHVALLGLK